VSAALPRIAVLAALLGSALALAAAPSAMPASYDWVRHTTSESAAQGVDGAWLARLGFVLFGVAVAALSALAARRWGIAGASAHALFGVGMLATAAFSHRPWDHAAPYDRTEDLLHSLAATTVGIAFAAGVVAVALRRRPPAAARRAFDGAAIAVSVAIPLAMTAADSQAGLLQRAMFAIAYAWYGAEALRTD